MDGKEAPEGAAARDGAEVRVIPPAVPLVAILLGVALQRFWPLFGDYRLPDPGRAWAGGTLIVGAILIFGLWPVVLFRRSGQDENPWKPTPRIIEQGPYRLTRNPMYVQMVLVCLGFAMLGSNAWILLLTPACAWALQRLAILPEEAYLERKFGEEYLDYKRRVRRWL